MKARGNQKSNEANQIKSSPHDAENHQKIVQNQLKNRWKSRLGLVLGALGGGLGAIWAPKAVWHRKKRPDDQKWPRLGSHVGVHFRHGPLLFDVVLRSFSSLHFDGYQDRFFMDVDHSCWIMFRSFWHKFPDCRQIRKMSFWYSIYYGLSTSASWKIKEKSKILHTFLDTFLKMATDIIFLWFWVDLDSILGCFWAQDPPKGCPGDHAGSEPTKWCKDRVLRPSFWDRFETLLDVFATFVSSTFSELLFCWISSPGATEKDQF